MSQPSVYRAWQCPKCERKWKVSVTRTTPPVCGNCGYGSEPVSKGTASKLAPAGEARATSRPPKSVAVTRDDEPVLAESDEQSAVSPSFGVARSARLASAQPALWDVVKRVFALRDSSGRLNPNGVLAWSGVALALLMYGWTVWPTPYEYREAVIEGETVKTRTSRLTGQSQTLYVTGWDKPGELFQYRKVLNLESRTSRISGRETVFAFGKWLSRDEYSKRASENFAAEIRLTEHKAKIRADFEMEQLANKHMAELAKIERSKQEEAQQKADAEASKLTDEEIKKIYINASPPPSNRFGKLNGIDVSLSNYLPFAIYVEEIRVVGQYTNGTEFRRVVPIYKWVPENSDSAEFRVMYDASVARAVATIESANRRLPK
jgi:hypothetical protein